MALSAQPRVRVAGVVVLVLLIYSFWVLRYLSSLVAPSIPGGGASSGSSNQHGVYASGDTGTLEYYRGEAKVDRQELGHSTWTMLHTMAANYPDPPTPEQAKTMHEFILTLAELYPCCACAGHFQLYVEEHPPTTNTRTEFISWLTTFHNAVNERLKKDVYPVEELNDKRWFVSKFFTFGAPEGYTPDPDDPRAKNPDGSTPDPDGAS